jgi:hypothetical protein
VTATPVLMAKCAAIGLLSSRVHSPLKSLLVRSFLAICFKRVLYQLQCV